MPTDHHVRQRHSPPTNLKKTAVRAQRPTALTRNPSSPKLPTKGGKNKVDQPDECIDPEENEDMATGFLQFCAMCERQIIVPNNSMLYCSQSCRRKDAEKIPEENPYSIMLKNSSSTYMPDLNDPFGLTSRTVVTRRRPITTPVYSKPPVLHNAKSDLDPTEWKPDLKHRAISDASEAFQYLSQFHSSTPMISSRRPGLQSRNTTSTLATTFATPSLSYTPTTSTTSSESSPTSTPYEFATQPIPPQLDIAMPIGLAEAPSHSSVSGTSMKPTFGKKAVAKNPALDEMSHDMNWVVLNGDPVRGGMKKMFSTQEGMELGGM